MILNNCSIRFTVHFECDIVQVNNNRFEPLNNKYQLNTIFRLHFIFHDKREKKQKEPAMYWAGNKRIRIKYKRREREIQKTKNHSLKMFCTLYLC